MILESLGVEDFRCVERAELELHPRSNLITGENASGKTTLLEAMFFLGRGRSFRTAQSDTLIRSGAAGFLLLGRVQSAGRPSRSGCATARPASRCAMPAGRSAASRSLRACCPRRRSIPKSTDSSREGRRSAGATWTGACSTWNQTSSGIGAGINERCVNETRPCGQSSRKRSSGSGTPSWWRRASRWRCCGSNTSSVWLPDVARVGERLLGGPVEIALHRGWAVERSLAESLAASWPRDRTRGLTHSGPHRADLAVRFDGAPARDRVSRGQQKLAAAALLLGQLRCDAELESGVALLLVDDPAAELDEAHLERLLAEVSDVSAQLVVTALDPRNDALASLPAGHRFHVEQGVVTRLL